MGFRQPFTVQADPKYPGHVVVGEYCHDNGSDFAKRAPAGTCEWNLVDKPGNAGWPFCVGDNRPALTTWRWNYQLNQTTDQQYDCSLESMPSDIRWAPAGQTPVEPSNDGLDTLPGPAMPATIWKKYGGLKGTSNDTDPGNIDPGGMSPVTGPVYRYNAATAQPGAFPPYYDGAWFITNRGGDDGWWKEARLRKADGKFLRVNDWMPIAKDLNTNVIPSRFGPDGALYMARWDSGCCRDGHGGSSTQLIKIEFTVQDQCLEDESAPNTSASLAGRKHPSEADTYLADATLTINGNDVGCAGVDKVEYRVNEGDWEEYTSPEKFATPGTYAVDYRATDAKGNVSVVKQVTFKVVEVNDHEAPAVTATVTGTKVGDHYSGPATLKIAASDPLSSITSIEYRVNQVEAWEKVTFSGENLAEEVTKKFSDAGFQFVEFRATDESGNTTDPAGTVQFSVVGSCVYPRSSEFDGPLDEWWLRHTRNGGTPTSGPFAATVANGVLTMPTTDFELDGNNGTTSVGPVNFLARDLPQLGDAWTVETEFTAQFTGGWQSMGLMLWRGDDNFFRSSLTHSLNGSGGQPQLFIEQSKDSPSSNPEGSRTQPGGNVNLPAGSNGPVTIQMRYSRAAGADVVRAQYKIISGAPASADWVDFGGGANFLDLNPSTGPRRDSAGSRIGIYSQGNFPGSNGAFAYAGTPGTMKVNYFRVTPDVAQPSCPDDDVTPPATTAALDPAEPGIGGTYTGPVDVDFTATDAKSVDYTQVKIDDGPWQKNENDTDESPFASTTTVNALGAHTIQYRSADKAGNLEPAKSLTFVIEKPPASQVRDFYAAGNQWDPTEAEVNFGDKVTWHFPATELQPHNVWLAAPGEDPATGGGSFISAPLMQPGSAPVDFTFRKAGTWTFLCTIHPGMSGTVKVGADPNPGGGDNGGGNNPPPVDTTPPPNTGPQGDPPPLPQATAAQLRGLPKKATLKSFLKKGLKVRSACQSGLKGKVTIGLSKGQARKVGGKKALTVASKKVTCASTGKASVKLKASKKAKKVLKKALKRKRSLVVSVRIKMGSGSAATSDRKSLKLKPRR
jgi:plastocyanin